MKLKFGFLNLFLGCISLLLINTKFTSNVKGEELQKVLEGATKIFSEPQTKEWWKLFVMLIGIEEEEKEILEDFGSLELTHLRG